ncbi:ANTAR domain-containing protein [Nocardia sp. NPDC004068]|uniref:ANTAR domain-containing protein n=1 Tax=Nocardia sp. NPDC004068 TaxID=3364303 RepID=UPI003682C8CA
MRVTPFVPPGGAMRPDDEHPLLTALIAGLEVLAHDFDVVDLAQHLVDACPPLTGGADAGLFLADHRRDLQLMASTSEEPDLLELLQVEALDGPGRHTFRTGAPTVVADLARTNHRWPEFCQRAMDFGYRAACALPLRARGGSVGALTILTATPGGPDPAALRAGQALADLAGLGITARVALPRLDDLTAHLPAVLRTRIVIEQAKGVLAERGGLDMAEAFRRLRAHAHRTGRRLAEVAAAVVDGTEDTDPFLD